MTEKHQTMYECDRCHYHTDNKKAVHSVSVTVQILDAGYPGVHFRWEHLCGPCNKAALAFFKEALK